MPRRWVPWSEATRSALYGHGGFYHRPEGPAGHFRTSVHTSGLFAAAVVTMLQGIDAELDHPDRLDLVDVGAGRGELLLHVDGLIAGDPALAGRVRLQAVELAEPPAGWPNHIGWSAELPEHSVGLLVANEWLDNVPVDVVEQGPDGPRQVLVDPLDGTESPGGPIGVRDAGWLARWWPLEGAEEGDRAEIGFPRDLAWARAVGSLDRGWAVAVDYGHLRAARAAGDHSLGTLTGYRAGRVVPAVPDGSCDLTSHVALDACEAAGAEAGATSSTLLRQADALRALGIGEQRAGTRVEALQGAAEVAELLDPEGLGAFWWLVQAIDAPLPRQVVQLV